MFKYREMDDGTLVNLALLGEEGAFDELVERYESEVKKTAEAIIGNSFSAEDAAQDTFFSAWTHLAELRYREKFGIWILRIAENRARTLFKHYTSRLPELTADPDSIPVFEEDGRRSLAVWEETEQNEKLRDAVDALSHVLRDTVRLHYLDGYSVREVSALLSVPEGTVLSRLHEGRKQLRRGFGIPEEGKGSLSARVKRQIEELKRWTVKNDKSGIADTYGNVLPLVQQMGDSPEKENALADVLLRGMWWIPGQDTERLRAEIKAAALEGHNEDVMEAIVEQESVYLHGEDKTRFIREKQIPEMETAGFVKPLGSLYFWLGHALAGEGKTDEAISAFSKVTEVLSPSSYYYACAVASLRLEPRYAEAKDGERVHIACLGESYEKTDGKWLFVSQPGYTRGLPDRSLDALPFCWLSRCDGLIDDPAMGPGDTRVSEDGRVTLTVRKADGPITVPAGTYGNCLIYETRGEETYPLDIETVVCPGVGIVRQTDRVKGVRFLLTSADVKGGGRIPFVVGNRWTYHAEKDGDGILWKDEQNIEIIYATDKQVTASVGIYAEAEYDTSTWAGNMAAVRNLYFDGDKLRDVELYLRRAEELASTPREKMHTAAAADAMRRIFRTDPVFNPDWRERSVRNYFKPLAVSVSEAGIALPANYRADSFEWKDGGGGPGFYAILYNYLYEITAAAWGVIWSDAWVPGFHGSGAHMMFDRVVKTELTVGEDEDVATPAGEFAFCRHVTAETAGIYGYWSGHLEFWYAPGVGLVKFLRIGTAEDEPEDAKGPFVWELTEYRGTGKGYFPLDDGLFRRYEPAGQPLPDGYRG
ncbi:MAG: RNA polymerase sigma factor, partial [Clostridia bacterium]|nr:RNA polymerase sigma factor [Clostridia bacterium]